MAAYLIIVICAATITFIVTIIQLAIGFRYTVKSGHDPNYECQAAPDLPLLMAIGGIFGLFFLGSVYGLLKMISSIKPNKMPSDVSGNTPKILVGLTAFIFGAIAFIFFILMQMRVYGAYSSGVQFYNRSIANFCRSIVMRGALAMIILTYINILLLIGIYAIILLKTQKRLREKIETDMEMVVRHTYQKF